MRTRTLTGTLTLAIALAGLPRVTRAEPLRWPAATAAGMPDAAGRDRLRDSQAAARPRDAVWNGVLIGAALGVLAIVTTAAEAPPSGKVTTVVSLAAIGAFVDSRLAATHGLPAPRSGRAAGRLRVQWSSASEHRTASRPDQDRAGVDEVVPARSRVVGTVVTHQPVDVAARPGQALQDRMVLGVGGTASR